jgi:diguanylate cyclase (GGDEF)-like protein
MRVNLYSKIILPTSALISLLILSVLLFLNGLIQDAMEERIRHEISKSQIVLENFLEDRFDTLFLNARVVAETPQFKSVIGTPDVDHETVLFTLQEMGTIMESDSMIVTDDTGKVLARSDSRETFGADLSPRKDIQLALQGKDFSSMVSENGVLYQAATLPVVSEGMVQGVLSVRRKIDRETAARIYQMTGSHVAFFSNGRLLAYSGSANQKKTFEHMLQNGVETMDPLEGPQLFRLAEEDHIALTGILPVKEDGSNLVSVVSRSLTEALEFLRKIQKFLLIAGVLVMVASVLIGFLLARGIAHPVLKLGRFAGELAKGRLDNRVEIESHDEVGLLGESLNRMAEDLSKMQSALMLSHVSDAQRVKELEAAKAKLDEYSKMLEDKVEERTLALGEANSSLKKWIKDLEEQRREITLLNEMSDLLQSCMSMEEAFASIARMSQKIFPSWNGSLSMISATQKSAEIVSAWGHLAEEEMPFRPTDCLALRNGRMYQAGDTDAHGTLVCKHFGSKIPAAYVCVPLAAHGETLGAIHFRFSEKGEMKDTAQKFLGTLVKNMALALANVKLRANLREQSIRDPLTGLFNRRYMEESLEVEIARVARSQGTLGVMMVDLDYFKRLNDQFGHEGGDYVLQEVGEIFKRIVRRGDIPCRYGGEEFLLIFPGSWEAELRDKAEQLRHALRHMNFTFGQQHIGNVTVSIGIALYPEHGFTANALIHGADMALYEAKKQGRDCVILATAG